MIKLNKEFISGLVIGFGSGLAVRALGGQEKVSLKGIVKGAMHSSLSAYEKVKDGLARTKENLEDLAAEVRSEAQAKKEVKVESEMSHTAVEVPLESGLSVASE